MQVGVVKEIKDQEYRVALTPDGVAALVNAGHTVMVEHDAGIAAGFSNQAYRHSGAVLGEGKQCWESDLVVKVKEPLEQEYPLLQQQILFTFLHLAAAPKRLTEIMLERKTTAIAYETMQDEAGKLPLLAPMSAIAGNMAALIGGYYLAHGKGGKGVQLGTVLGEHHGKVVVIGDGVVGHHAARTAAALGADVWVATLKSAGVRSADGLTIHFFQSTEESVAEHIKGADLVIGAVLRRGAIAPYVVTSSMVKSMESGSVVVDVSIDQGGCIATSRPTSHSAPVFLCHGVIHYCVTNMPGAYPRTSTIALSVATQPYVLQLAEHGLAVIEKERQFASAVNTYQGNITCRPVAEALGLTERFKPLPSLINQ